MIQALLKQHPHRATSDRGSVEHERLREQIENPLFYLYKTSIPPEGEGVGSGALRGGVGRQLHPTALQRLLYPCTVTTTRIPSLAHVRGPSLFTRNNSQGGHRYGWNSGPREVNQGIER
eukprot:1737863-Pyramimonas_sp.AAC.1